MVVGVVAMAATMQSVWTVSGDEDMSTVIPQRSPVLSTVTALPEQVTVHPMDLSTSVNLRSPWTESGFRFLTVTLPPQTAANAKKYEADE
jgi:hypothetical protein